MDVVVWLRSLGLGQYEAAFRENEIDETILPGLTAEDLKDLGVGIVGHRRKILHAIAALRPDETAKGPSHSHSQNRNHSRGPRRTPPRNSDVLGPRWLDGTLGTHGPRGPSR